VSRRRELHTAELEWRRTSQAKPASRQRSVRRRRIVWIALACALFAALWATTPEQCRVDAPPLWCMD